MHRHLSKLKNKKTLIAVLACLGIILTTVGVTVAWFTYARNGQKENSITSGKITFIYQENEGVGNGISLTDAMPMPDSYGKTLEEVFDFRVTSTSGTSKIPYEITLRKTDNSDDIGNTVKVYLTKVDGANEEQKVLSMYSNLSNSTNTIASINNEKTLYQAEIQAGASNYTDNYRLRIWLNDNPSDGDVLSYEQTVTQECTNTTYTTKETCEEAGEKWLDKATPATEKNFTVKVNVYAEGEAANAEEIAGADSTSIRNISIGNTNATLNTDETQNYDFYQEVPNGTTSVVIDVQPSNVNESVSITSITQQEAVSIKQISANNEFPLNIVGDNYFKITVTSANKQHTKIYVLNINRKSPMPVTPIIDTNIGYPILTTSGMSYGERLNITFESELDVINYVSFDGGNTWEEYTGNNRITSLNVIAKSVIATDNNVYSTSSATLVQASGSLSIEAYNGDSTDYTTTSGYILVDSSVIGSSLYVKAYIDRMYWFMSFINSAGTTFSEVEGALCGGGFTTCTKPTTIPANTAKIYFDVYRSGSYGGKLYEISLNSIQ